MPNSYLLEKELDDVVNQCDDLTETRKFANLIEDCIIIIAILCVILFVIKLFTHFMAQREIQNQN